MEDLAMSANEVDDFVNTFLFMLPLEHSKMGANPDIVVYCNRGKKNGDLERPGHPPMADLERSQPTNVFTFEDNLSSTGIDTRNEVKQGGLPRPVRAGDTKYFTLCHLEIEILNRG